MKHKVNTILLSDGYKYTQWRQYPKGTDHMGSYVESRGSSIEGINYNVYFGPQAVIQEYLAGSCIEQWMIEEAEEILGDVFGTHEYFNKKGFQIIVDEYGGKLPLSISSVPEGTKVPISNIVLYIKSTDKRLAWLEPWVETIILRAVWYPSSVATISSAIRDVEKHYANVCGCELNPFFVCDFGSRGGSSYETICLGSLAHLITYLGTDTISGIPYGKFHYGKGVSGHSVYATEHSSTTIYLKENEVEAYRHFLTDCPLDQILSMVIDSYDPIKALTEYFGKELKPLILARKARTMFRPDSGDPVEMSLLVIETLWNIFGGTINEKGFKVLNPKVGVIYGDGINIHTIKDICQNLVDNGFSTENICFGMGGKLLQGVDRDTFKYAEKLCYAEINGVGRDVYKDPVTDKGKRSKRGQLKLINLGGKAKTVNINEYPEHENILKEFFYNGEFKIKYTFDEVRANANNQYLN